MLQNLQQSAEIQQLFMLIRKLEARVAELEDALVKSGNTVQLKNGATTITLMPHSLKIESNEVSIKAAGDLTLKGSNIRRN